MSDVMETLKEKIEKSIESVKGEMNTVRAGRANPALLDRVQVDYYGNPTPLKQLANISCPDPRTILVVPFDPQSLKDIEHGIQKADLGINPNNDGKNIILAIPQLTEERRKELSKMVHKIGEEGKVSLRNLRKHANDAIKKSEKDGEITEDDMKSDLKDVQDAVNDGAGQIDEIVAAKEKEIMEV
jgi:ribosome recycling factor